MNFDNYPMSTVYELLKLSNQFYVKTIPTNNIDSVLSYDNTFRHEGTYEYLNFLEPILKQRFKDRIPFNDYNNEKFTFTRAELNALYNSEVAIYQAMPNGSMDEKLDKLFQKNRIRHILLEIIRKGFDAVANTSYRPIPTDFDYNTVKSILSNLNSNILSEFIRLSSTWLTRAILGDGTLNVSQISIDQNTMDYFRSYYPSYSNSEMSNIICFILFIFFAGMDNRYNTYTDKPFMIDFNTNSSSMNQNLTNVPGYINMGDYSLVPRGLEVKRFMFVQGLSNQMLKAFDVDKLDGEHIKHMIYNSNGGTLDIEIDLNGMDREERDYTVGCFGLGHKILVWRRTIDVDTYEFTPLFITNTNLNDERLLIIASAYKNISRNVAAGDVYSGSDGYYDLWRFFATLNPLFGYNAVIQQTCRGVNGWEDLLRTYNGVSSKSVGNLIKIAKDQWVDVEPTYYLRFVGANTSFVPCVLMNVKAKADVKDLKVVKDIEDYSFIDTTEVASTKINYNDYNCWKAIYTNNINPANNRINLEQTYGDDNVIISKWIRRINFTGHDGFSLNRLTLPNIAINDFTPSRFALAGTATSPFYQFAYDGTSTYDPEKQDEFIAKEKQKLLKNQSDLYEKYTNVSKLKSFSFKIEGSGIFDVDLLVVIDDTDYLFKDYNYQYDYITKTMNVLVDTESKITDEMEEE